MEHRWGQSHGDTDTQTRKKQRQGDTFNNSLSKFLKAPTNYQALF